MTRENNAIAELLLASMPPDGDIVDLIEIAFLEGQLEALDADLAYLIARIFAQNRPH